LSQLEKTVDAAIQIYGKPYQTAATLYSLARHSERWISTVFVSLDRRQPEHFDFRALLKDLPFRVRWHRPGFWLGSTTIQPSWKLRIAPYRRSIRYQFAWEETRQRFLFVTHNDMLYRGDLIGAYLDGIGNAAAIGSVGQCWNCEANYGGVCSSDRYREYRPTPEQYIQLLASTRSGPRRSRYPDMSGLAPAWPLPECRLNEFAALINMDVARPLSYPKGPVLPFGGMFGLDLGAHWFRQMCTLGRDIRHFNFTPLASHGWAMDGYGGDVSANDPELYRQSEQMALELLRSEYGWSK